MANRLTVVVELGEDSLWYATSPDEKGLLAVGKTPALALKQASWALLDFERARKGSGVPSCDACDPDDRGGARAEERAQGRRRRRQGFDRGQGPAVGEGRGAGEVRDERSAGLPALQDAAGQLYGEWKVTDLPFSPRDFGS